MKHLKIFFFLILCQVAYTQTVKIDSSWVSFRRYYTTDQGYLIGSDSIRQKRVRATVDGGDTTVFNNDSIVSRTIRRFITIDSLSPYLHKDRDDTVTTYYTLWKNGSYEFKITNNQAIVTDGTYNSMLAPNYLSISDGGDFSNFQTYDNAYLYNDSDASKLDMYSNHMTIDRAGYSATGATEVPILSEVKALINDSIDVRLTPYTPTADLNEKIEDQMGTKIIGTRDISPNYVDATGETTLVLDTTGTVGLATKYDVLTTGSGLSAENVFDTLAYSIRMGEGLKKTKSDTGDSLLVELKLKDALERIVWSTGCHKMVFMPGNTTGATATWGVQVTVTGTVTAPGKSTSSKFMFSNRWETLVTAPSTTAVAGFRCNTQNYGFGNSAGMGGYYFNGVTGPATGVSTTTHRYFFGMTQSIANPTDAQPSAQISCFGIGYDAADANLQFMHNDASGTCTKVDLGSNFPVPTSDRSSFWRLIMYSPSNTQEVYYKVIDMLDGDVYTGVATTDLPANTDIFSPRGYASVGGTSSVIGFAIQQLEIFCDF